VPSPGGKPPNSSGPAKPLERRYRYKKIKRVMKASMGDWTGKKWGGDTGKRLGIVVKKKAEKVAR